MEGKFKQQPKIAIDGTEHALHTTDNNILHRKFISTPPKFQRSPKKDVSPKKHALRGPGGKYVSASEKAKNVEEEGTILASKPKVRKVESDEDGSDFECYNKSDGTPVHVDIDKEITEGGPALALPPNKSEEEMNDNGETMVGTVIFVYAGPNEHVNHRTDWVAYHIFEGNI